MPKFYTGKQVIKAGEDLINIKVTNDEKKFSSAMDVLSFWRFSHEEPLKIAFSILQEVTLQKD